jgi:hypothetical protein
MAVIITPEELYYGSPTTLTYGGVDIGGTTEPPTVSIEITEAHPDFQNAAGPVVGTSVITDVVAAVELTVNQLTAEKLAWALPGATSAGGTGAITGGGGDTTLTADVSAGDTIIPVAATTGLIVGDNIRIGDEGEYEFREITAINSLNLTVASLGRSHDTGDQVVETDDLGGGTTITWTAGRVPTSAYKELVLVGQGLDGRTMTTTLSNAYSSENISIPFGKGEFGGLTMRFVAYYNASTPLVVPFSIAFAEAA